MSLRTELELAALDKKIKGTLHKQHGSDWRKRVFDFYTFEGAVALRDALKT